MDQFRALKSLDTLQNLYQPRYNASHPCAVSLTSQHRLLESLTDSPIADINHFKGLEGTVLYLAYGSNLSAETFLGRRGIRPVSHTNVVVPELVMTFDLPGIPYSEPCFANTGRRDEASHPGIVEKKSLEETDYHKDRWHKGLVGVVYEVTRADYAKIIATEGGGTAYQDILVDCYTLSNDSQAPVPEHPRGTPFKAHTLFAPNDESTRSKRPDRSWAQPSPRYMKLIIDGANEHNFPLEYKSYLCDIRTYSVVNQRQRLGQWIFLTIWIPLLTFIFENARLFSDEDGRYPPWLVSLSAALFRGMWASYDGFFKQVFGEGERTVKEEEPGILSGKGGNDYGSIEPKDLV